MSQLKIKEWIREISSSVIRMHCMRSANFSKCDKEDYYNQDSNTDCEYDPLEMLEGHPTYFPYNLLESNEYHFMEKWLLNYPQWDVMHVSKEYFGISIMPFEEY